MAKLIKSSRRPMVNQFFEIFFPNTCDLLPFYKRCRSEASFSLILMGGDYGLVITKQNFLYIWCKKILTADWCLISWFHLSTWRSA